MDKQTQEYRKMQLEPVIQERLEYPHINNIRIKISYHDKATHHLNISLEELSKIQYILTSGKAGVK
jgi:hypothetical protein